MTATPTQLWLLDTNIISHVVRHPHSLVAKRIQKLSLATPQSLCTSVVVACELQFGIARKGAVTLAAKVDTVLRFVAVLSVDREVIPHYAAIRTHLERAGTPIGPNDTLIAAHARALGATLVSGDAEFARVPGLQVENWLAEDLSTGNS
jgi:tRNA(fMet)-specific endonuclease VapC